MDTETQERFTEVLAEVEGLPSPFLERKRVIHRLKNEQIFEYIRDSEIFEYPIDLSLAA